jgi:PAS domain S-box-containing protein
MPDLDTDNAVALPQRADNAGNHDLTCAKMPDKAASAPGDVATGPGCPRTRIKLSDLVDLAQIQRMAEANYRASGMPIGIIDAADGSILVGVGWQDICAKFHRVHPVTKSRCEVSDKMIQEHIQDGNSYGYKCKNGLWDIGIPIIVGRDHLATLFLGQFFYKEETIDYSYYSAQAKEFGFDPSEYRKALDNIPIFSQSTVENILIYNKAFAGFIASSALSNQRLCIELTARKKAEIALNEKAVFIECMMNAIPSPIYFKDTKGIYRDCNDAFAALLGKAKKDIIGSSVFNIAKPDLAQKYHEMDNLLLLQSGVQIYEWKVMDATGDTRDFLFTKTVLTDDNGTTLGLIGIMTDITDRKTAERSLQTGYDALELRVLERTKELEQANSKLINIDKMKSAFLNTVSHDIRTPLTAILGFMKLIHKDIGKYLIPNPAMQHTDQKMARINNNIEIVFQEGERLTRLVNDFLDLSKIESGKTKWNDASIHIDALMNSYINRVKPTLPNKDTVRLIVDIAPDLPPIQADPDRITQVIDNIFSNAVKFTAKGSIAVSAKAIGNAIQVRIEDSGIGIPKEDLKSIFDEFYQTNSDTMRGTVKGTGLGLAICKNIVNHYGGRIWAESSLGQGSCVTFELPVIQGA